MKSIEYLISTMNQNNIDFFKSMNIKDDTVIVNQADYNETKLIKNENQTIKFLTVDEKGLSKSRNMAIYNSTADICVFADDDFKYYDDASKNILEAYKKHPDADIIAFYYHSNGRQQKKYKGKEQKINFLTSLKLCSAQITFKRCSIIENDIRFNENFGAGAEKYKSGEENIFLYDCLKKGLKIYLEPVYILEIEEREKGSVWFDGYNKSFFETKGAAYYEMTHLFYWALILQFAIRKRKLYKNNISVLQAITYMFNESKNYKKKSRKKVYMLGDVISNTGPAIVNKNYYSNMQDVLFVCKSNNKIKRLLDFLLKIRKCDVLLISGLSKFQLLGCKIGKKLNKKVIYLMHGYAKIEYDINEIKLEDRILEKTEDIMLEKADKIICVSYRFSEVLKTKRPDLNNKIDFINNGINKVNISKNATPQNTSFTIISVGGGMKIKNNLAICRAIDKINTIKIKFIVIGKLHKDGEEIKKYDFVEYYDSLTHEKVMEKMRESDLYIQNSYFETFGLAVIEAIQEGCDILVSKNIGAIDVIDNITEKDIIDNNEDIEEIVIKIEEKYKDRNQNLGVKEEYSIKNSVEKLKEILIK